MLITQIQSGSFFWITFLGLSLFLVACGLNREAKLQQAQRYLQENHPKKAARVYKELIQHWPEDVAAIEGLIASAKLRNATNEAIHWSEQLLRFRPWSRQANLLVGQAYLRQNRLSDAVSRFMLAMQESDFQNQKQEVQQWLQRTYELQIKQMQEVTPKP